MYPSQPSTRADSPAHRLRMSFPLLTLLTVREAMRPAETSLLVDQTVAEAVPILQASRQTEVPVFDNQQRLVGGLSLTELTQVQPEQQATQKIAEVMSWDVQTCASSMTLYTVLRQMIMNHVRWVLVLDQNAGSGAGRLLGVLTIEDILRQYQTALPEEVQSVDSAARSVPSSLALEATGEIGQS